MNMKQLTMAAAVSTAIGGVGVTQANIGGVPGEALLVPFVDDDTYVQLLTPGAVGIDTVINQFTAPNTTPDEFGDGVVHWFLFDHESKHVCDGKFPMTADDVESLRIGSLGGSNEKDRLYGEGCFDVDYGYAIFTDEEAIEGGAASRPMFGDAQWRYHGEVIEVPVVPMSDGDDSAGIQVRENEVTYSSSGTTRRIAQASPIAAGVRFDDNSGVVGDVTTEIDQVFHDGVGNESASMHFFWFDQNAAGRIALVDTLDQEENRFSCKDQPLPYELNIVLVENNQYGLIGPEWGHGADAKTICGNFDDGFLVYNIPEYQDEANGSVDSAGYAWAVHIQDHRKMLDVKAEAYGYYESWLTEAKLVGKFPF